MGLEDLKQWVATVQKETYFLSRDKDGDDLVRVRWYINVCQCKSACTVASFRKAQVWSFVDEDTCRALLYNHLVNPSHHNVSHDAAFDYAIAAEAFTEEDYYSAREDCRRQLETSYANDKAVKGKGNDGDCKGKNKARHRSRSPRNGAILEINTALCHIKRAMGVPTASSSHAGASSSRMGASSSWMSNRRCTRVEPHTQSVAAPMFADRPAW